MPRRLTFCLEGFFPGQRAGTEQYVLELAGYMAERSWEVSVIIPGREHSQYLYGDIPVYVFPVPVSPDSRELNGRIPPRGIEYFMEVLAGIHPDIVHFHSFGRAINGYHLQAVRQLGLKTVFTPHLATLFCSKGDLRLMNRENCDGRVLHQRCLKCIIHDRNHHPFLSGILARCVRWAIRSPARDRVPPSWFRVRHRKEELERIATGADRVIAIAPWIEKAFRLNGIPHAAEVPQGISTLFTREAPQKKAPSTLPLHLAFIGRMHPDKGFHLLMEALDQLEDGAFVLQVATQPAKEDRIYYERSRSWAEGRKNVNWQEQLDRKGILALLGSADLLILPSVANEMAPLVILEAFSRQVPVIASDYIAMKDLVVDGKNGTLFSLGESASLAEQLERVIADPSVIDRWRSGLKIPPSMDQVGEQMESIYHELLAANP